MKKELLKKEKKEEREKPKLNDVPKVESKERIFDNFYGEDASKNEVAKIIVKKRYGRCIK